MNLDNYIREAEEEFDKYFWHGESRYNEKVKQFLKDKLNQALKEQREEIEKDVVKITTDLSNNFAQPFAEHHQDIVKVIYVLSNQITDRIQQSLSTQLKEREEK